MLSYPVLLCDVLPITFLTIYDLLPASSDGLIDCDQGCVEPMLTLLFDLVDGRLARSIEGSLRVTYFQYNLEMFTSFKLA